MTGIAEAADEVLEMARACLASPVVARALAADELWREVPYTRRVADGYATGRIDLVFREGDELVVADWKSDSVGPDGVEAAAEAIARRRWPTRTRSRPRRAHARTRSSSCFPEHAPSRRSRLERHRDAPTSQ